jgi:hypothetical protein
VKYKILKSGQSTELEEQVNFYASKGWELRGELILKTDKTSSSGEYHITYIQVMTIETLIEDKVEESDLD